MDLVLEDYTFSVKHDWEKLRNTLRVLVYKIILETFYGKKRKQITFFYTFLISPMKVVLKLF